MQGETETNASEAARLGTVARSSLRASNGSHRPRSRVTFADQAGRQLTQVHVYECEVVETTPVKSSGCCGLF